MLFKHMIEGYRLHASRISLDFTFELVIGYLEKSPPEADRVIIQSASPD